jgi:hypothetical protein
MARRVSSPVFVGRAEELDALASALARSEELGRLPPELPSAHASGEPADPLAQSRLFEALLGLLARLGREQPVVPVVGPGP